MLNNNIALKKFKAMKIKDYREIEVRSWYCWKAL
jgi:hypothetical protein